jgi:hypothetical protein
LIELVAPVVAIVHAWGSRFDAFLPPTFCQRKFSPEYTTVGALVNAFYIDAGVVQLLGVYEIRIFFERLSAIVVAYVHRPRVKVRARPHPLRSDGSQGFLKRFVACAVAVTTVGTLAPGSEIASVSIASSSVISIRGHASVVWAASVVVVVFLIVGVVVVVYEFFGQLVSRAAEKGTRRQIGVIRT